ncbi:MAG TPA: 3-methyl-2-oxobutanoate hydroxymethyltransferase [Spirochaetota bacterium]|nr:3-methyl-2-oxobutanoate hydroxymethyltransferase [Spirochaetota bacterium]
MNFTSILKNKKQKKEKILVFSLTDFFYKKFFDNKNIDILRFDLDEFALLNGYKNSRDITDSDILPLLKNVSCNNKSKIAIDLPFSLIFTGESYNLGGIVNFIKDSNCDYLIVDCKFSNLIKKLSSIGVEIIVGINNENNEDKNKKSFEDIFLKLKELENIAAMFILHDFPEYVVNEAKNSFTAPVISNTTVGDGFYGRMSEILGLVESNNKKYLNLSTLIDDGIKDAIFDVTKK